MACFDPTASPVSTLTVQQGRFAGIRSSRAFRAALAEQCSEGDALVFAVNLRAIASKNGFGGSPGDPRRAITICAWRDENAARDFLETESGHAAGNDWSALLEVLSTRGDHRGAAPLTASSGELNDGRFAALTLGTTRWRSLIRFMVRGSGMRRALERSPGLMFATSAGWPTTGNSTFSIWQSEQAMKDFAYGSSGPHVKTAHARRPVLSGQLNARMRVIELRGELPIRT